MFDRNEDESRDCHANQTLRSVMMSLIKFVKMKVTMLLLLMMMIMVIIELFFMMILMITMFMMVVIMMMMMMQTEPESKAPIDHIWTVVVLTLYLLWLQFE